MIDGRAPVEAFDEIDSTILEARRRAQRGELSPVWLLARRQTVGRGRRGRAWLSFDGNLLATYLSATDRAPADIALLGFVAGVAIAETIESYLGRGGVTLKWPNDVRIDCAKVAGILIESGAIAGGASWLALAFGVNLVAAPKAIDQPTISLRQALPPDAVAPDVAAFFANLRPRLESLAGRLAVEGFEPVRRSWLSRAEGLGREIRILAGSEIFDGRMAGLSPRGELELDAAEGRRLIAAGDVFFPQSA
jgi:BirA family biotin operon repressor/biotin-[acetyl-CoA-carboxylase] ligase